MSEAVFAVVTQDAQIFAVMALLGFGGALLVVSTFAALAAGFKALKKLMEGG